MPRYLSIVMPTGPMAGPPSAEHMQAMGKLMDEQMKAGKLIMTGALKKRDGDGFTVTQKNGEYIVDEKPTAEWMLGGGWAILQANDRADCIEDVKKFLSVAGDGRCEVMELFQPPGM
jgi:hypothetical protein